MTTAREIVRCLLETEADPEEVDAERYFDRYTDAIAADEARGKITMAKALTTHTFYHRTERYVSRGKKLGPPYQARRNGATKTWKTRPGQFRIPVKIGFRGYGYIDNNNADEWSWRPDFQEAWEEYAEKTRREQAAGEIKRGQDAPLKPSPQGELSVTARDPKQPELFNESLKRLLQSSAREHA